MPRRPNTWLLVFLALMWFGATFVYFGDTGKHGDDFWAAGRLIENGEIAWSAHPWQKLPFFWRPFHLVHVWVLNTIFWRHDWVMHLELALVHGAVCVMLYRLLVGFGSARGPALAAALLFGTCPLLGEAIGWSSASCNAIGSLLMLATLRLGLRFGTTCPAQDVNDTVPSANIRTLRPLLTIASLSFATACFYEPAAGGLAAMPVVVWAAASRTARANARIRRTVLATIAAGAPCVLYAALLLSTAPPGQRGSIDNVLGVRPGPGNTRLLARAVEQLLFGARARDIVLGSIEQGFTAAREHAFILAVIALTALAGLLALPALWRSSALPTQQPDAPKPFGRLLLLGVAVAIGSLIPFAAQHVNGFELRSMYVPLLGFAAIIAAGANALCFWAAKLPAPVRTGSHLIAAFGVGLLAIVGELGLVGMQTQFHNNALLDAKVAGQLAALAGSLDPHAVVLILAAEHRGAATSRPAYNRALCTALEAPWSANAFLRRSTHRGDVRALCGSQWTPGVLPIDHLSLAGVQLIDLMARPHEIEWSRIVPVWTDPNANLHVAESLTLQPLEGPQLVVHPAQAHRLALATLRAFPESAGNPRTARLVETAYHNTRAIIEAGDPGKVAPTPAPASGSSASPGTN